MDTSSNDIDRPTKLLHRLRKTALAIIYQKYFKRYANIHEPVKWLWGKVFWVYRKISSIKNIKYCARLQSEIFAKHATHIQASLDRHPWLSKVCRKPQIASARSIYKTISSWLKKAPWKRNTLVQLSRFANGSTRIRYHLVDESMVESSISTAFTDKSQHYPASAHARYVFPKIFVTTVQRAQIYGGTNMVQAGDQVLCHDLYDFKLDYTSEELHGRAVIYPRAPSILWLVQNDQPGTIPVAASFVDSLAINYAHWITEVLSKVSLFCSDPRFDGIPIIVDDGLHHNIMESLFLVSGNRKIITIAIGKPLTVDYLYLISPTGYTPFDMRPRKRKGSLSQAVFSSRSFTVLRESVRSKLAIPRKAAFPEKIYLRRNSGMRRLLNQSEIESILLARGFLIVATEQLCFAEQVMLFQHANVIIGPAGAAFANIVFSNPQVNLCILTLIHEKADYRYWINVANAAGINKISYLFGEIVQNKECGVHGDYQINPDDLLGYLNHLHTPIIPPEGNE